MCLISTINTDSIILIHLLEFKLKQSNLAKEMKKSLSYEAIDIANWFINQFDKEVGDVITHLKIQKLLYYSQAWSQLLLEADLFEEEMEAWAHGPVVRAVYNEFRDAGWEPLSVSRALVDFDTEVTDVLSQVLETYGESSAKTLEHMTHQDKPWIEARGHLSPEARCNTIICKSALKTFFMQKYGDKLHG